jgi:hypothetical protein
MPATVIGVDKPPYDLDAGVFVSEIRQVLRNTTSNQLIVCGTLLTGDKAAVFLTKVGAALHQTVSEYDRALATAALESIDTLV